ncbi:hypothetical protein [Vagococcus fluvialis]|jgi:hypothetical protein|uniref:hypothetical protein n=1 Tax=Vagococcus fluvialis TaxID=2738 RepID=UPI001A8F422A|nr:hypothetical protein [Vagococcus fluvialis]MBO0429618.1 hypothetical protein [Vagococcus fluvialis]MDR2276494.1 hypothetical protein [Vagococcus sp.]
MEIIYPPLVEDSLAFHLANQEVSLVDKAEMYSLMVKKGILLETGEPTQEAIEKGWVKDFYEEENLTLEEFLKIYPIFHTFALDSLQLIDGFWEITLELKEELINRLRADDLTYDEKLQIREYLAER